MTKAIIIEDEIRNAAVLKKLLAKYCPDIEIVAVESTVKNAVAAITQLNPALIFLDVELPDGTGFNVLEHFPDNSFSIIFVTAYEHYAIKAIKACALDYLLKPVDIDDLIAAVNKAKTEKDIPDFQKRKETLLSNNSIKNGLMQKLALPTLEGLLFVNQQDIVFCEADGNYTNFKLFNQEKVLVSKALSHFEDVLDPEQFCRTHQSYLVNINHIKKYVKGRGGYLIMTDDTKVEVSVRMKSEFLERFFK
jgi:two-component system LytT family response regulator